MALRMMPLLILLWRVRVFVPADNTTRHDALVTIAPFQVKVLRWLTDFAERNRENGRQRLAVGETLLSMLRISNVDPHATHEFVNGHSSESILMELPPQAPLHFCHSAEVHDRLMLFLSEVRRSLAEEIEYSH